MYNQIDDVSMGCPLAPVLDNLSVRHDENLWLSNYRGPSILFYRRYVDDTFYLFKNAHEALRFSEFLNSQHSNGNLLLKKQRTRLWRFLMFALTIKNLSGLVTSVYRKPTFAGLLPTFFSFTSYYCKLDLIHTLLNRAYEINNSLHGFNQEVKTRSYFQE